MTEDRTNRPHIHSLGDLAEALYMSTLQESQQPTAEQVRAAVDHVLTRRGDDCAGCAAEIAWQYGHDPLAARDRMAWALAAVRTAYIHTVAVEPFTHDLQTYSHLRGRHTCAVVERERGILRGVLALSSPGHGYRYMLGVAALEASARGAVLVTHPLRLELAA